MRSPGRFGFVFLMAIVAGPSSRGDDPVDPDRVAIESLANEIIGRIDAAKSARARRLEAENTANKAKAALSAADKDRIVSQIAIKEYLEGTFPQDVQTQEGAIKLAQSELARAKDRLDWSNQMVEKGAITRDANVADKMALQKCEISLANELKKKELLVVFTRKKTITNLESHVQDADRVVTERKAEAEVALIALEVALSGLADERLSEAERQALTSLDDAIAKFDSGDAIKGRESLAKAQQTWQEAKKAREVAKSKSLKARIRMETLKTQVPAETGSARTPK